MKFSFQILLLVITGLGLAAGGVWAGQRELAMFAMDRSSPGARMDSILATPALPPSIESRREILNQCSVLVFSTYARARGEAAMGELVGHCAALAEQATSSDGANSLAWSLRARTAGLSGEFDAMNQALALSFATGRSEQWLADSRFATGEKFRSQLSAETSANHEADIRLMLASNLAIETLVREYLAKPDFRDRLVDLVDTLPEDAQRAFLGDVRRISMAMGGRG